MPGYGAVPIVSDAVVKGIRGIDARRALECAVQSATLRRQDGIGIWLDREYIPADKVFEATSKAMEYAVGDWGIAAMARKTGDRETERVFSERPATGGTTSIRRSDSSARNSRTGHG